MSARAVRRAAPKPARATPQATKGPLRVPRGGSKYSSNQGLH
jgi:hypothetical protein